eukprot:TRINITY_DN1789_c0_g1_i1.p1 TRINITY_DN1789_c0_g1~~TRINITY_DN1789_c0_g1_i1.p1  ORF type:complete len:398 (-),score=120.00 TRINITY_DN1789_c0_g1_i1:77-1270(-)
MWTTVEPSTAPPTPAQRRHCRRNSDPQSSPLPASRHQQCFSPQQQHCRDRCARDPQSSPQSPLQRLPQQQQHYSPQQRQHCRDGCARDPQSPPQSPQQQQQRCREGWHHDTQSPQRVQYEVEAGLVIADAQTAAAAVGPGVCVLDVCEAPAMQVRGGSRHRVSCVPMPSNGGGDADLFELLPPCFDVLAAARRPLRTVIVCCETGRNQSVTVVLAYLTVCCGFTLASAVALLQERFRAATLVSRSLPAISDERPSTPILFELPPLAFTPTWPSSAQAQRGGARNHATPFGNSSCFPAPEVCYLAKLLEVERSFNKTASFPSVVSLVAAVYGAESLVDNSRTWQTQLLREHQCSACYLLQFGSYDRLGSYSSGDIAVGRDPCTDDSYSSAAGHSIKLL